jgi:hypothetical protein
MSDLTPEDVYVLGFEPGVATLIRHLRSEAPGRLARLVVVDPDPGCARDLEDDGVRAMLVSAADLADLRVPGLEQAAMIVCFQPERIGWRAGPLRTRLRERNASARVFIEEAPPVPADPSQAAPGSRRRWLGSWRFWLLVAIGVIDALVFVVPLTAGALVVSALLAPHLLRRAARFLEAVADARG